MQKSEELGNMQETVSEAELGWLAGLLDADGTIAYSVRRKHKGYLGMDLSVSWYNTDGGIVRKAVDVLNKIGVEPYISEAHRNVEKERGTTWLKKDKTYLTVRLHKQSSMRIILHAIYPYLAGEKRHRAYLVLRLLDKKKNGSHDRRKSNYDIEDWYLLHELYKTSERDRPIPQDLLDRIPRDYTPEVPVVRS